jgi:hypothetical protein
VSDDLIDQMPESDEERDLADLEAAAASLDDTLGGLEAAVRNHPSSWTGPRTHVYELRAGSQVLVTDYADGRQTLALRENRLHSWGPEYEAVVGDA